VAGAERGGHRLNLGHPLGIEFLRRWQDAAREGTAFRGIIESLRTRETYHSVKWNTSGRVSRDPRVLGHRHDQSVAGVLAGRLGMNPSPHGLRPFRREWGLIDPRTVILLDRDLGRPDQPFATVAELCRDRYAGVLRVSRGRR
jgi:hypothetical protein